jgi:protein involved in polysaccharide export with SLBB domain
MTPLRFDGNARGLPKARKLLCTSLSLAFVALSGFGQTRQQASVSQTELARQNLSHVAASVGQLVVILHRDPGLMVEVKRWIAKDATDHGQLIGDSDLAEEVIFDRLETDTTFRAVVTGLVQKYGYLQPLVNPESPLAKQQELLIQERVKLLAQEEEADRAKRKEQETKLQETQTASVNCSPQTGYPSPTQQQQPGIDQVPNQIPGLETPDLPSIPYVPEQPARPNTSVTELLRTSGQDSFSQGQTQTGSGFESSGRLAQGDNSGEGSTRAQRYGEGGQQGQALLGTQRSTPDQSQLEDLLGQEGSDSLYSSALSSSGTGLSNSYFPAPYSSNAYQPIPCRPGTTMPGYNIPRNNAVALAKMRSRESTSLSQRLVRSPNPYNNIPSLYDMYLQAVAHPPAAERFGMQVFENGTRDLQSLPMDLPAGPDYVLGSGDGVSVDLWGAVTRRFYRVIDREGRISLPEVGPVLVAGKSMADAQTSVQQILRTQFRDISADLSLARLRTVRVYVVGDVVSPGAYDVGSLSTPLNALFAAGGPTGRGSLRIVKHFRGNQLVQDVDVYDLLLRGVKGDIERLENGDTVMVPPLGPEITVEGMVRRPAVYEQKDEKTLAEAIALAGGLLPTATLRHVEVQRTVAHEKQTMLSLDIPQDDTQDAVTKQLESFQIQDGDRIRIFPIAPYTQDAVYLEGHVIRPGKYSYRDGMRVTDLIGSYKDLLPEPALQYGEIIRLSAPDYRPTVESFNLGEALEDPQKAPLLKPLDTVQLFGRYDFENPPEVSVLGEVRDPGTYRASGDIHLSDAVHLAGGLGPDAETIDAQVFRYMPDSTMKILNVKLDGALDGSPSDNIVLKSRDRVLIHKNAAATDPATVYVKGEVARPGRYPLTSEMRVSDLVHAAGGLKQSADTASADLTHYLWKDEKQVTGKEEKITLASALTGGSDEDHVLNNGDVLTIRQLAGWEDLGASVAVRGEVVHPGSYGIRPSEKLSSVLLRAGGFAPGAYPYGTVLVRSEVQKLEQRSYGELVQRVREQQANLKLTATSATDPDQKLSAESALTQWQTTLDNLISAPPAGRVTIQISSNIKSWANTPRDITLRAGDILTIPKRPSYVLVQGQVYGPTAVAYRPGKSARWYLAQAGGTTNMANRRGVFVIRADGTVVGSGSFWGGDSMSVAMQPGDMVVVPEKALGGPPIWKTLFQNAQILSSITTSAILASKY